MTRNTRVRRHLRLLYLWHRRLGILAGLLVVILSFTGLLLNHSSELKLAKRPVTLPAVLRWYGLQPSKVDTAFRVEGRHISLIQETLYLNEQPLPGTYRKLIGTVALEDRIYVMTNSHILMLTPYGELIESQALPDELSTPPVAMGRTSGAHLLVKDRAGILVTDADMTQWDRLQEPPQHTWSHPESPPESLQHSLQTRHSPLSLERLLLDLHSGRVFGSWGIYFMDAAALILLLLSLSGSYLWLKHHKKPPRRHGKKSRATTHDSVHSA